MQPFTYPDIQPGLCKNAEPLNSTLDAGGNIVEKHILFCNVGWMREYQGITTNDKIVGGGAYVRIEQRGHEVCNFSSANGKVYGYVQPTGSQIKIERIGASKDDDELSGVDVVFTARRPGTGGTVVVGWYKNATIYRRPQFVKGLSKTHESNGVDSHWVIAAAENSVLLPLDQRNIVVPRGKGGMGKSNVWFADSPTASKWVSEVKRSIDGGVVGKRRGGAARQQDPLKKAKVEKAAIELVTAHYEKMGYIVNSVEQDNVGWDLEASESGITLLLEVKGLSSSEAVAELTPNEYKQMSGNRKSDYRLCIVTSALSDACLNVFSLNHVSGKWSSETNGAVLSFKEKIGAVVSCI